MTTASQARALERVRRVARAVVEQSEPEAVGRLHDADQLRDALVVAGALALLREARGEQQEATC